MTTMRDLTALADGALTALRNGELVGLRRDVKRLRNARLREIEALQRLIDRVNNLLRARAGLAEVEVSDHAVLRYLERIEGVDVQAIRDQIARTVQESASTSGDRVHALDGLVICLADGKRVTTVFSPDGPGTMTAAVIPLRASGGRSAVGVSRREKPAQSERPPEVRIECPAALAGWYWLASIPLGRTVKIVAR